MTKYGIPFSTIRYWQRQGQILQRYSSGIAVETALANRFSRWDIQVTAREIGHYVIMAAAVRPAENIQAILRGTW